MEHNIVDVIVLVAIFLTNDFNTVIQLFKFFIAVATGPRTVFIVEHHRNISGTLLVLMRCALLSAALVKAILEVAGMNGNRTLPIVATHFGYDHFTSGILGDAVCHGTNAQTVRLAVVCIAAVAHDFHSQ